MKTLLFVDCCISQRREGSRTRALAESYLAAFRAKHPDWAVERVDAAAALPPITEEFLDRRDALARKGDFQDPLFDLARQFQRADAVVVAAPYWDLSYPAQLKTYIEHVSACGLCYHYEADGCHGDCRAERLVYLTSGGDFEQKDSIGVAHFKQLCGLFGIPRFDSVFAGGLDIDPEKTRLLLEAALEKARALA